MNYVVEEIKQGIKVHYIKNDKYKTNLITVFLSVPLDKNTVTENALITSILRMGSKTMQTQEEINKKLEEMYGAEFNCGVEKVGDNQLLKFYIEVLNDKFLPEDKELLIESINRLLEIIFTPYTENNMFSEKYVQTETNNLRQLIESKINDKDQYSLDRCIEEMYKEEPYSIYKYGYLENLDNMNNEKLYEQYKNLVNTAKIDIYISGDYDVENIKEHMKSNEIISNLGPREPKYIVDNEFPAPSVEEIIKSEEKMNVTQGKLVMGLNLEGLNKENTKYIIGIYNVILGGSATSKLFQNVREKASLAYSARSTYVRQKDNIFIRCGIEINNYEKALEIINKQIEDMKSGNFTDEDLDSAKKTMVAAVKTIQDEQDNELTYYIAEELSNEEPDFDRYIEETNKVTKEQIVEVANKIKVNAIYFLRN